jgi:hypothetical protein
MRPLPNSLWVHTAQLTTGRSHAHHYEVAGKILGDKRFDTAAYLDDSYPQSGVHTGQAFGTIGLREPGLSWLEDFLLDLCFARELTQTRRPQLWSGRMVTGLSFLETMPGC